MFNNLKEYFMETFHSNVMGKDDVHPLQLENDSETTSSCLESSDEESPNEQEMEIWTLPMEEIQIAEDRVVEELKVLRQGQDAVLKDCFAAASDCFGDTNELGSLFVVKGLNDVIQKEFDQNCNAVQHVIANYYAKASTIKSKVINLVQTAYRVPMTEATQECTQNDQSRDGWVYLCICTMILCVILLNVYPSFYATSLKYFFWKLLPLIPIFVFCMIVYIFVTSYPDHFRKLKKW